MSDHTKEILNQALGLSPVERAELIEHLLTSFEYPVDRDLDKQWGKEAEERIEAYETGKISSTSAGEVFNTINQRSANES